MSDNSIQLFSEYADLGHLGRTERTRTYTLRVGEGNVRAIVTLEFDEVLEAFPGGKEISRTKELYEIPVQELIRLIRDRGRKVDAPSE